ncbi:MAG: polymer-forming cytoskeletal protein [Akkermansiaceae bacterium]|nr:polymer-forming cytoskeletal protein [Akkermansiaceae bacterium]
MFNNYKKTESEHIPSLNDKQGFPNWSSTDPIDTGVSDPDNLFPSAQAPTDYAGGIAAETPESSPAAGSVRNVLNQDVSVVGTLRFTDDLLIDGNVEGEIFSDGVLTVGANASIQAEIKTKSAIIHGEVTGNVTVTDRVELSQTAKLVGDVVAATLSVQAGAVFIGRSTVGNVAGMAIPGAAKAEKKPAKKASAAPDLLA